MNNRNGHHFPEKKEKCSCARNLELEQCLFHQVLYLKHGKSRFLLSKTPLYPQWHRWDPVYGLERASCEVPGETSSQVISSPSKGQILGEWVWFAKAACAHCACTSSVEWLATGHAFPQENEKDGWWIVKDLDLGSAGEHSNPSSIAHWPYNPWTCLLVVVVCFVLFWNPLTSQFSHLWNKGQIVAHTFQFCTPGTQGVNGNQCYREPFVAIQSNTNIL